MAGANKILKPNQLLFKAGDKSDGMYIIRKGELRVFLEQSGKEVTLSTVEAGSIIGEMALFDQKPRSASVKATKDTEVTLITNDEFQKLMKQIPKWFVSLMVALSTRLRTTNERLQKLEAGGGAPSGKSFQNTLRLLHVFNLFWHKDGQKDGKDWILPMQATSDALIGIFGEPEKIKDFFNIIIKEGLMGSKKDGYNNVCFVVSNKGILQRFIEFMKEWLKNNPELPFLPPPALDILKCLKKLSDASAYESVTISPEDLEMQGKKDGLDTSKWKETIPCFKASGESLQLVKTSNGNLGFRVNKKTLPEFIKNHAVLANIYRTNIG